MRPSALVATLALIAPGLSPTPAAADALPWLTTRGAEIVDSAGAPVTLRGFCLGSWLFAETWIGLIDYPLHGRLYQASADRGVGPQAEEILRILGPQEGVDDAYLDAFETQLSAEVGGLIAGEIVALARQTPTTVDDSEKPLRDLLVARHGAAARDRIFSAYQDAWITEADFDLMAEMGTSLIRLPMTYRQIVAVDEHDVPLRPLTLREPVMARVDEAIRWAEARGIYVTLDIQEAPGGQNDYSGDSTLYEDPEMQALTLDMWEALSDRYRDESSVAMYSLLAEPMSAPSTEAMVDLYDRIYDRIRATGDRHLMVIHDGFRGVNSLPDPGALGWSGVVYSTHIFEWGMPPVALAYKGLIGYYAALFDAMEARYDVPFYVGSFSTFADERHAYRGLETYLQTFNDHGYPWTMWTWKRIDDPIDRRLFGDSTTWGVVRGVEDDWRRVDPWLESEAEMTAHMPAYRTEGMTLNTRLQTLLKTYLEE